MLLCLTSLLFIIPGVYHFKKHNFGKTYLCLGTTICSFNYWRNPLNLILLKIDRYMARTTCVYYMFRTKLNRSSILHSSITGLLYMLSNLAYNFTGEYQKVHCVFHICTFKSLLL